jgi:hypothetical protein
MGFPPPDSEDFKLARKYAAETVCPEWQNGILAVDGSIINVFQKPGFYGEFFLIENQDIPLAVRCVYFLSIYHL